MRSASPLAAGVASLPDKGQAFAAVQGAWRFHNNERVTLPALVEPLRAAGRNRVATTTAPFALLVHDWSKLTYAPGDKTDLAQLTHAADVGYELTTALLVSADDGSPLAPMEVHCRTAAGFLSTRPRARAADHLGQVLPTMAASTTWGLSKPTLHVIDREADSVGHYRRWHRAGHKFLVRVDDRHVLWDGSRCRLSGVRRSLGRGRHFRQAGGAGGASYRGRAATLFLAETEVVLDRAAKRKVDGRSTAVAGAPLTLRLVLVQVRGGTGAILAEWLLLSNAPRAWATTEQPARSYYWRWRIEHDHPGAEYFRAEVALSQAIGDEAVPLRRSLLNLISRLPADWQRRFEQPDLLLAPPVPFRPAWWAANAHCPVAYRSLPNLDHAAFDPGLPWLTTKGVEEQVDQVQHIARELVALASVQLRAADLGLTLPLGFEAFAYDFPRRDAVSRATPCFEVLLHDATIIGFPRVGEGHLVSFFGDMNYRNSHQLTRALYLVPGTAFHCVVVFELGDDADNPYPNDPNVIYYCAPSFQTFLLGVTQFTGLRGSGRVGRGRPGRRRG
ncbi:hypothetical protein [Gemmata sp.]|uniref:hypothetical protein n=1 Tax=Gemmata sp. TaxID=1914242 RepID=UPI003F6EA3C1